MKVMILAAGRGERMMPLTKNTPKPLLHVRGKPLISWHIQRLAERGFKDIVINIAYMGYKIPEVLGDGSQWGVNISYSDEQEEGALESAGAIRKALSLLKDDTFLVVNGDIWTDYEFDREFDLGDDLAHLILVDNPKHNKNGDFGLKNGRVLNNSKKMFTFSGIGYYKPEMFKSLKYEKLALAPVLRDAISKERVSGSLHVSLWHDIGTPQRLQEIDGGYDA
jgi:MurNAc alpha-1-phosphate uridylyltransferase